jgi:tRNA dimethylallyltransferase
MNNRKKVIMLAGPTAVGKTELSLIIGKTFSAEIIGVDSMQIYRHMNIGTAKPSKEERSILPHHLIDFILPDQEYHAGRFVKDSNKAINKIRENNNIPLLVGGTGLYYKALFEGLFEMPEIPFACRAEVKEKINSCNRQEMHSLLLQVDKESAKRIHPNDTQRLSRALEVYWGTGISWSTHLKQQRVMKRAEFKDDIIKIGLTHGREKLYKRINLRTEIMLEKGLIGEVEKLLSMGYSPELSSMQSIGYRHVLNYLNKSWTYDKTVELLARDTRRYAKRQYTWFNKDKEIQWFNPEQVHEVCQWIQSKMNTEK